MNSLEIDIRSTRKKVIQCLTEYEKNSQQLISQHFNTQLHNILDAISSFDSQKIKLIQPEIKDQVVIKHLNKISAKIKAPHTQNNRVPSTNVEPKEIQAQKDIGQAKNVKESKPQQKKDGLFDSVIKRFYSKEKKASQIILPDKEPDCYFDEVRRAWVFQGEEPDLPKQIPKPPSKSEILKSKQAKPAQQATEMNSLIAPPEFKRRGGSANTAKKAKKQIKTVQKAEQPLLFDKLIQNINKEYENLLEKVRLGAYQTPVRQMPVSNNIQQIDLVNLAQVLLHSSEQVGRYQHKLIQKLNRSFIGEEHQLKLLQKIMKEISQSSNIYYRICTKIDSISKQKTMKNEKQVKNVLVNQQKMKINFQLAQKQNQMSKQMQKYVEQINELSNAVSSLQSQKFELEKGLRLKEKQIDELALQNKRLLQQNQQFSQTLQDLALKTFQTASTIQQQFAHKELQLTKVNQQLAQQKAQFLTKLSNILIQNEKLLAAKSQVDRNFLLLQSQARESNDKIKEQILKQKTKIQSQLKFYQQSQKNFLKSMKNIFEHTAIIQQFQESLNQENKLFNALLQQRVKITKINNLEESIPSYHKNIEELSSPRTIILQLSAIINNITQTNLQRLQSFNRNYTTLSKKYEEAKEINKKMKNSISSENMSLNRNVARLKSLIESYKMAKEEVQEKCVRLELEFEKLKKKLEHYKAQDTFNKSYLSKLKSSDFSSQNESVLSLQEDNQELTQTIEDLQKQVQRKDQNCSKMQSHFEDILANYEKTQQKLLHSEKKAKEGEKQLRGLRDQRRTWLNKVNLLQVKLLNQKEKNQESVHRQASKLKTIEANHQKKMKILRESLERAQSNEQYLKKKIQELGTQTNVKVNQLELQYTQKIRQFVSLIGEKNNQLSELMVLFQEANKENKQKLNEIQQLKQRNQQIIKSIREENKTELQALKQSQLTHKNLIQQILAQFKIYKEEEFDFRKEYQTKIQFLIHQLQQSQEQSRTLVQSVNQYSSLLNILDQKLQYTEQQKLHSNQQNLAIIQSLKSQNYELHLKTNQLLAEAKQKDQQIFDLSQLSQSLSKQLQNLKEQNINLLRQKQQNLKISQQMQAQLNESQDTLRKKNQEITSKQALLKNLEQKLIQISQENIILCNEMEENEALKAQLSQKIILINRLQNDIYIKAIQIQQTTCNKQGCQFYKELEQQRNRCLKNQQQLAALSKSLKNKQNEIREVGQALERCSQSLIAQSSSSRQLQLLYLNSKAQLGQVQQQLAETKIISTQFISDNALLKEQVNNITIVLEEKQIQLARLQENILSWIQKNNQQANQISQLEQSNRNQKIMNEQVQDRRQTDVQGEMYYLLKEIEKGESQIARITEQMSVKDEAIIAQQHKNRELRNQLDDLTRYNTQILQKGELLQKRQAINAQKMHYLNTSIETLQNQNKQLRDLLYSLSEEKKQSTQEQISIFKTNKIVKLQAQLASKVRALLEFQNQQQQNERLLIHTKNEQNKKAIAMSEMQIKIGELQHMIEKAHSKRNSQDKKGIENNSDQLREVDYQKEIQIIGSKAIIQQMQQAFSEKQMRFQRTIENLEAQIASLNKLKVANKNLQDQYKQLESQNSALLSQKVELLRSNENLMKINQKLIIQISPHNKIVNRSFKTQQKPQNQVQSKLEAKQETKNQAKQEAKGFLGTLSSLFLTPTETDRLVGK